MAVRVLWGSSASVATQLSVTLRLTTGGGGDTLLTGTPQLAIFKFFANYLARARNPHHAFQAFASLSGSARLETDGSVVFTSSETVSLLGEEENATDRTVVTVRGGDATVVVSELALPLPKPPDDARYLEIGVQFEVDGQIEAALLQNDCLDLNKFRSLTIKLGDEADQPVPFEKYVVTDALGTRIEGHLDGEGTAFVQGLGSARCRVDFPDADRVEVVAG